MIDTGDSAFKPRTWQVGALCRAVADALDARFNPVAVSGEISGFSRATSGHCYFSLKDEQGQLRCAMFRRAASLLNFTPRDGDRVEVRGRLDVYGPRGDLQLIVESMSRAGQGTLFEEFLKLKERLAAQGLFDAARKRPLPIAPRAIGVVTSLGAAALSDVVSALRRRVPHIPVVVVPAAVQGAGAPVELVQAVSTLGAHPGIDVLLLVRGGGSMEDLWAFNNEQLAHAIVSCPVPVISGVGHETDFTIADFCADLRAPTPTAAAELAAQPLHIWLGAVDLMAGRLQQAAARTLDMQSQRLDTAAARMGRPSVLMHRQQMHLNQQAGALGQALRSGQVGRWQKLTAAGERFVRAKDQFVSGHQRKLDQTQLRMELLNPRLVLQRGYAWLTNPQGVAVTHVDQVIAGQQIQATLVDGQVDLTANPTR